MEPQGGFCVETLGDPCRIVRVTRVWPEKEDEWPRANELKQWISDDFQDALVNVGEGHVRVKALLSLS